MTLRYSNHGLYMVEDGKKLLVRGRLKSTYQLSTKTYTVVNETVWSLLQRFQKIIFFIDLLSSSYY